jgi:hypothetical protein
VLSSGSSSLVLLISKVTLSAGFTLAGTAAVERLGPRIGGLVAAVPQLAVVSLIFFAIEQGLGFAAESAFWSIPGMCATLTVLLGYLAGMELVPAPRSMSIAAGVALGTVCFALSAALLSVTPLNRWSVIPVAAGACFGISWILRRLPDTTPLQRISASPWLYAIRAGTSVLTVLTVTGLAPSARPQVVGPHGGIPGQ